VERRGSILAAHGRRAVCLVPRDQLLLSQKFGAHFDERFLHLFGDVPSRLSDRPFQREIDTVAGLLVSESNGQGRMIGISGQALLEPTNGETCVASFGCRSTPGLVPDLRVVGGQRGRVELLERALQVFR
jgi:hypothetical protein